MTEEVNTKNTEWHAMCESVWYGIKSISGTNPITWAQVVEFADAENEFSSSSWRQIKETVDKIVASLLWDGYHQVRGGMAHIAMARAKHEGKGFTPEGDKGRSFELADAAISYTHEAVANPDTKLPTSPIWWPWSEDFWKPEESGKDNLIKAGGLIAAAIDAWEDDK